jgi:hypothetical protein
VPISSNRTALSSWYFSDPIWKSVFTIFICCKVRISLKSDLQKNVSLVCYLFTYERKVAG